MRILVISNKVATKLNSSLFHLFGAVKHLTAKCDVLLLGSNLNHLGLELAQQKVVDKILLLDNPALEHILVDNIAKQVSEVIKGYTHVMVAADNFGKNLLPRVAGILDTGQISEVTKIISPNIYQKFMYAGNVLVEVESLEDIKLLTIRASNFIEYSELSQSKAPVLNIEFTNPVSQNIKFIAQDIEYKVVDLSNAKVVVSGGRSLGSKDAFDGNVRSLAQILNAATGATRAAVEAGFASNDIQVGQTGKIIAPQLYLAFGVSGAVQHIAGIKNAKVVVAVNTDQTAPIFEYADYGLVADLFEIIPSLIAKINK